MYGDGSDSKRQSADGVARTSQGSDSTGSRLACCRRWRRMPYRAILASQKVLLIIRGVPKLRARARLDDDGDRP